MAATSDDKRGHDAATFSTVMAVPGVDPGLDRGLSRPSTFLAELGDALLELGPLVLRAPRVWFRTAATRR